MFRPGATSAKSKKGNVSDSDSDWDTTVDFPSPEVGTGGNDTAPESGDEGDLPVQTKSKAKSQATHADKRKEEDAGDGAPHNAKRENSGLHNERRNNKTPASASAIHLSPMTFDSDSRSGSPVAPFLAGYRDGNNKNNDKGRHSAAPSPAVKSATSNRYEMSPTPKIPASMEVALPRWDDSDAEQQTLQELRANLKKEKNRKSEEKAALKKISEGGDLSHITDYGSSVPEKRIHGRDKKDKEKTTQEEDSKAVVIQERKTGLNALPPSWLQKDNYNDNALPVGMGGPYQPLVVKTPDGRRFLYNFSEGSTSFYEVEEENSEAVMPKVAEKVEGHIKRGWQEFFGVLRIMTSVFVYLVVEGVAFITDHITRPLMLGIIVTAGNRLVKPLLAGLFNLVLQPFVIFAWNVASGLRQVFLPLVDILGSVLTKCAFLLQAFRLVEVNYGNGPNQQDRVFALGGGVKYNSEIV